MNQSYKNIIINSKNKTRKILDIKSGTNSIETIKTISEDVYLRGPNIVYLVCSAILASVGLDVGSPAVIIGAMLISPLMSPILGIGLSLGIHDKENFIISLREFIFSILLSLFVSFIYFLITPLGNPTIEIIARVKPTVLDILIAFFGGVAGIVAVSRSKIAVALPGVAIATALMPPICTAGFGLATARFEYFFGAIYLFFINAVFISFSSYLIVRYLKFPFKEYPDRKILIRTRIVIIVFVIIVAIPSFFIFYKVLRDIRLNSNIARFINESIQSENTKVIEWKYIVQKDKTNDLNVFVVGDNFSNGKLDSLDKALANYGIPETKIKLTQLSDEKGMEYLRDELRTNISSNIKLLQKSNEDLEKRIKNDLYKNDSLKLSDISNELKVFYPDIIETGFSYNYINNIVQGDSTVIKKLPVLTIRWRKNYSNARIQQSIKKIYEFAKTKIMADTIVIINQK